MLNNLENKLDTRDTTFGPIFTAGMMLLGGSAFAYGFTKNNFLIAMPGLYLGLEGFGLSLQGLKELHYINKER